MKLSRFFLSVMAAASLSTAAFAADQYSVFFVTNVEAVAANFIINW